MKNEALAAELTKLGLSEKEARVYLAALGVGPAPIQRISQEAGVKRVTTYVVIDSLIDKGLMSQTVRGKKTLYLVENPEILKTLIAERKALVAAQEKKLTELLPQLSGLFELPHKKPEIRYFTGSEVVAAMLASIKLGPKDHIRSFSPMFKVWEVLPELPEEYSRKRIKLNIHSKVLYAADKEIKGINDPAKLREARFIPAARFPFSAEISIFRDRVHITTFGDEKPVGVIIEEQHIADTLKRIFDLLWESVNPAS